MTAGAHRRFTGDRLIIATHNRGKVAEFSALLGPRGIALVSAADLGLPEPAETEATFAGNARIKARAVARAAGAVALADDSGIVVDGLDGAPGVRTADWATMPDGSRDFVFAMTRVHDLLVERRVPEPWSARFCCVLVLAWPDGQTVEAEGAVEGRIVWPMRGRLGHGFDPVFVPEGETRTFAEMPPDEKNRISHRAVALRALIDACFT